MAATGPGFNGGGCLKEMISLVDVPPTLLDAAGLDVPDSMVGHSMMPLTKGDGESEWPEEVYVQISEDICGRAVRTQRWKYGVTAEGVGGGAATSDTYTETHLYDLKADPYELNNLIGRKSHLKVAEVMRERLLRSMDRAKEERPQILLAEEHGGGQLQLSEAEIYA
jgi:arylsulfatase A-like enzyme